MIYVFDAPDRVMVGTRGEVGKPPLPLPSPRRSSPRHCQVREAAPRDTRQWLAQALGDLDRPGHLHDAFELEPVYEPDFVAGEITVSANTATGQVDLTIESADEEDSLTVSLTREWAGGLAIAIARLVDAGRPACPLCGGPLDPRGHDCPRTNGHRAPIR